MEAAIVICQQIFSILALMIFPFKDHSKTQNRLISALASRSGFGAEVFGYSEKLLCVQDFVVFPV